MPLLVQCSFFFGDANTDKVLDIQFSSWLVFACLHTEIVTGKIKFEARSALWCPYIEFGTWADPYMVL